MKERFILAVSTVSHYSHDYVALSAPFVADGRYVCLAIASVVFVITVLIFVEPAEHAKKGHKH